MNQEDKIWCLERMIIFRFKQAYGDKWFDIITQDTHGIPGVMLFMLLGDRPKWSQDWDIHFCFKKLRKKFSDHSPLSYC